MSGGYFEYQQYRCNDIADEIQSLIDSNSDESLDEYGGTVGRMYGDDIIEKFKETVHWLRRAGEMAQRVDWLISNDDGEDCFRRRWEEEVRKP